MGGFDGCVVRSIMENLSNYQRDYDAAKAAGAPELAMQENMELFTADKIGDVIDTQQLDISSRFETIEQYKDFYKGYLQNKNVRYIKNEELYNDARPVYMSWHAIERQPIRMKASC